VAAGGRVYEMNQSTMRAELRMRWQELHQELLVDERFSGRLAGLFEGHQPEGYQLHSRRILYVGKATAGEFGIPNASHEWFNVPRGSFWAFARRLSLAVDGSCNDLSNLAWSNLCKIGVKRGNPDSVLADEIHVLAVKTLQHEFQTLDPSLVVFVTETYLDHFVYEALNTMQGIDGFEDKEAGGLPIYFRKRKDGFPPVLWIRHPQGKPRAYTNRSLEIAVDLLTVR